MNVMCWVEMLSCGTSLSPKIKYTIDQQTAGWIGQTIANKTSDQTVTKSSAETDRNTRVCFSFSLHYGWLLCLGQIVADFGCSGNSLHVSSIPSMNQVCPALTNRMVCYYISTIFTAIMKYFPRVFFFLAQSVSETLATDFLQSVSFIASKPL